MSKQFLFAVYLGGKAEKSNIEIHDLVFVVGEDIKDTYSQLKNLWFGSLDGLHIDGYVQLNCVDGYEVSLIPREDSDTQNLENKLELFAINLGAYQKGSLVERHDIGFYVCANVAEAVKKAKSQLLPNLETVHKDNLLNVDDCIQVNELVKNWQIELSPTNISEPLEVINCYIAIPYRAFT